MAGLTARARWGLTALAIVWAAVVIPVGTHKGGDFTPELAQSDRLLQGLPLYDRHPSLGAWWPPFATLLLVPFALVARATSLTVAKALWATFCAACVIWSVARAGRAWGWAPAVIGSAVVVAAIQNSFQHLQITTVLLPLVVAAALALQQGRDDRAGAALGAATAVKAFPALLLAYLAYRRRWRALLIGTAVAGALTVGAMLPYGPVGAVAAVRDWLVSSAQGTGVAGLHMQKLARLGYALGGPLPVIVAAELFILCAVAYALRGPSSPDDALADVAAITLVAVLISPIGWYYYFGLLLPAWIAVLRGPVVADPRLWRGALVLAGVLISGVLGLRLYPSSWGFIAGNNDTLGGLLLLALLLVQRAAAPRSAAPPC